MSFKHLFPINWAITIQYPTTSLSNLFTQLVNIKKYFPRTLKIFEEFSNMFMLISNRIQRNCFFSLTTSRFVLKLKVALTVTASTPNLFFSIEKLIESGCGL